MIHSTIREWRSYRRRQQVGINAMHCFVVPLPVIFPLETFMLIRTAELVAKDVSLFLLVNVDMPFQVLFGNESLPTLFASVSGVVMPSIVVIESMSFIETLATFIAAECLWLSRYCRYG